MSRTRVTSFVAGMLLANSLPHLASAITGRRHMTPLAGRRSDGPVNGVWAAINIAAGLALLLPSRAKGGQQWDRDLSAFELGSVTFATWMAGSELVSAMNSSETGRDD
ncbi:hypothetical protein FOE78_16915 [Microlunatus elymi]|uniref:Uncharacterized protein n=1 Tax=Microlunatus elymi TaxID=2596828 RepID=A0A516Q1R5_9ACTN|nr:hypothetical protein [Microlunatus elymi]QDP97379.1 hypothetical protein FOE78_16915 [Microlunatus elymi]